MTEHKFSLVQMREAIQARMATGHSVFSPSSSEMWLGCSGSLIPNLFAPDDAGEDAAYGTVGHSVGEEWLRSGKKPQHMVGRKQWVESGDWGFIIPIDEVMLDYVEQYVRWCDVLPGTHYTETRVDFSVLTPIENQGGTADHAACSYRTMVITDLKMGKGIKVYAKNNTQARLYALGFFYMWDWLYDFQKIIIRIGQPRLDHWDEWEITRKDLLEFAEYVKERAAAAWEQNAPRTPSDKACQWCRVATTCGPHLKQITDAAEGDLSSMGREVRAEEVEAFREKLHSGEWEFKPVSPLDLSTSDLERIFKMRSGVESLFKKIGEELRHRAHSGYELKLFKLGEGMSRRVFTNPEKAAKRLIDLGCKPEEVWQRSVPSPAQAEDLLRKAGHKTKDLPGLLKGLVFKPPGGASLVPIEDSRASKETEFDVFGDD